MMRRTSLVQMLCVAMLGLLGVSFAEAQLSTSVSQSLDSNIYGQSSNAAATPSTEIVPGANNLQTPEEREKPYDAIGASVVATTLDPTVTQYYKLSRIPSQVDGSVRDETQLTGQHQQSPINVIETMNRRPSGFESSTQLQTSSYPDRASASLTAGFSGNTISLANGYAGQGTAQTSSWGAGSSPVLPLSALLPSAVVHAASSTPTVIGTPQSGLLVNSQGGSTADQLQPQMQQTTDYSRSPLEAPQPSAYGNQTAANSTSSPFKDLNQTTFLNPDIVHATSHLRNNRQERTRLAENQNGNALGRLNAAAPNATSNLSRSQMRLLRQKQASGMTRRPKWHNPILEQMESGSNQ